MKPVLPTPPCQRKLVALCCALMLSAPAFADERESVEAVRQTTLNLIDALVETGVLTREKADALIRSAQEKAAAQVAAQPAAAAAGARVAAQDGRPTTTPDGKPILRVPYVPKSVRDQIMADLRGEVMDQARAERWGIPDAPSWMSRIKIDGDLRLRYQTDMPSGNNTAGNTYRNAEILDSNGISRAPDFAAYSVNDRGDALSTANTTESISRERLRLRLGVSAKVTDSVAVGVRLATGNATDRVSTNQTLGQNFNKYQFYVDRAFVRFEPTPWLSLQGGRIPNPWFGTEMVWNENLNFEGFAATVRQPATTNGVTPFATVGYFPLREETSTRNSRSIFGAQIGADYEMNANTRFKVGLAYYRYNNIAGQSNTNYTLFTDSNGDVGLSANDLIYGRSEYPVGLRQRGNTVFETAPLVTDQLSGGAALPLWGLAYDFRPIVLTASATFTQLHPFNVMLTAEYANNTAFSESDFHRRADPAFYSGVNPGGRRDGYNFKLTVGSLDMADAGDWQANFNYRHVGSDAVLDAFTDADLGLGGTNLRGFSVGVLYGLYRNTTIGLRYLSAQNIDTTLNSNFPTASYKVDSLQGDLNVRF